MSSTGCGCVVSSGIHLDVHHAVRHAAHHRGLQWHVSSMGAVQQLMLQCCSTAFAAASNAVLGSWVKGGRDHKSCQKAYTALGAGSDYVCS